MRPRILVTGSSGLIGHALIPALQRHGKEAVGFDILGTGTAQGDVCCRDQLAKAIVGVSGISHLAAVSRVIWGERDPQRCWKTNVGSTRNVIELASSITPTPWVVFASSREVYGHPDILPANEDTPVRPVNIYGRSKAEGERLIEEARHTGLRACTVRFSNVFGTTSDHPDRVVPAFARLAVAGSELQVEGADHTFDFTYIDDVVRGIASLVELLCTGTDAPPPIHFVSGQATTLGELAALAIRIADTGATIKHAPARSFDVARFVGDGTRARQLLDWQPRVNLCEGLTRLVRAFQAERETTVFNTLQGAVR